MPESSLLIHGVRAIGRKFPGEDGSSLAEFLGISLTAATFQAEGTAPFMMMLLKRSRRMEGHLFRMVYDILSRGEGADEDLDFLITRVSSSGETGDMSMAQSETGGGGEDIHDGVSN